MSSLNTAPPQHIHAFANKRRSFLYIEVIYLTAMFLDRLQACLLVDLIEFIGVDIYVGDPMIVGRKMVSRVSRVEMLYQNDEMFESEDQSRLKLGFGHLHLLHPRQSRFVQDMLIILVYLKRNRCTSLK